MALLHVNFFSEVLGMCAKADVILPDLSREPDVFAENGKVRVMYLLHGLSDDQTNWQRYTGIEEFTKWKNLAVIMPTTQRGWYSDMYMGFNWYTYITQELPEIMHRFFPCLSQKREDTIVAGLSMGGYGAMKIAMRNPERYSCGAALSGAFDVEKFSREATLETAEEFEDTFGPVEQIKGSENDLFALADRLKDKPVQPHLFMCCGKQDFVYDHNVRLRKKLMDVGADLTYEESDGDHNWKFWDTNIQRIISWFDEMKEEV